MPPPCLCLGMSQHPRSVMLCLPTQTPCAFEACRSGDTHTHTRQPQLSLHSTPSQQDFRLATAELALAAAYLTQSGAPSVGVIGGCMGGALAFAVAEKVPSVTAAVALYGTLEPLAGHLRDRDGSSYFQVRGLGSDLSVSPVTHTACGCCNNWLFHGSSW